MTYSPFHCSYLAGISSGTPRFTTWFGAYTDAHRDLVKGHYDNIGTSPTSVTYDCSTCSSMDNSNDIYAYVYPNESVQSPCVDNYNADTKTVPPRSIFVASRHYYIHDTCVIYNSNRCLLECPWDWHRFSGSSHELSQSHLTNTQ